MSKAIKPPARINEAWLEEKIKEEHKILESQLSNLKKLRKHEEETEKRVYEEFQQQLNYIGLLKRKEYREQCKEITKRFQEKIKEVQKESQLRVQALKNSLKAQTVELETVMKKSGLKEELENPVEKMEKVQEKLEKPEAPLSLKFTGSSPSTSLLSESCSEPAMKK